MAMNEDDLFEENQSPTLPITDQVSEVKAYLDMKKEFKYNSEKYPIRYVISKEWISHWKSKVDYHQHKPHNHYAKPHQIFKGNLPQINNSQFLIDPSTYYKPLAEESFIFDSSHQSKVKFLSEAMWNVLVNKYKGGPVIQVPIIRKSYGREDQEVDYLKISIVLCPLKKEMIEHKDECLKSIKTFSLYLNDKKAKLNDLKERIATICDDYKLYSDITISKPEDYKDIHLWFIDELYDEDTIRKAFASKVEDIATSNEEELDISGEFGFKSLENLKDFPLSRLFEQYKDLTIVYELSTPTSPFIFKAIPTMKYGQCEYNRTTNLLTMPCACKEVWYCDRSCLERDLRFHENNCRKRFSLETEEAMKMTSRSQRGRCGLSNLGNTCFMNTALQCLSNCYWLTQYFLSDSYIKDINEHNPLGAEGNMAKTYSSLLKHLWYGESSSYSPHIFKNLLGQHLKMFSGYHQHDTQEFLNYLLDILHEDLNRVVDKPLVEKDDSPQPDDIKSKSHWIAFLKRNQSVLVDIFYGQYKSTLICPEKNCGNISITFDPFLSISLPLVSKVKMFSIKCIFVFHDISITPISMDIPFYKETTFMALRNKIGKMLNIHPWSFIITKSNGRNSFDEFILETKALHPPRRYAFHKKQYYIFQLDPAVFYSSFNQCFSNLEETDAYQKHFDNLDEYCMNRLDMIKHVISEDYQETTFNPFEGDKCINNGLSDTIVSTIVKMEQENSYRIVFPHIMLFDSKMTSKELHYYLFKKYYPIISKETNEDTDISNQGEDKASPMAVDIDNSKEVNALYSELYKDYTNEKSLDSQFIYDKLPFKLQYSSLNYMHDYPIPYDDTTSLGELMAKVKEDASHSMFGGNIENKPFTICICWNRDLANKVHRHLSDTKEISLDVQSDKDEKRISIYECFDRFVQTEVLEEHNEWYCSKCKEHRRATKKIELYKSPHVLIVHLKRFNNNSKLDCVIDFPITGLDISKYVISKEDQEMTYDLFAISNHYGSMGFGHYVAYAKNHEDGKWYDFNDSSVSEQEIDRLVSGSAYVLFYQRRGIERVDWEKVYNKPFEKL